MAASMTDLEQQQYEEQHRRWYAEWIRKQYDGPGCRAKIVGRAKYEQIVRAVRGELRRAADNSKFRFWVRAKGFRMGRPASSAAPQVDDGHSLYVVDTRSAGSAATSLAGAGSRQQHCYKKVAVVDEFFDIIYRVHCSGGGISARHSGQKRTHRMIMETYAFLPREAVTAFLMGCPQCSTNNATTATAGTSADGQLQRLPQPTPRTSVAAGGFGRDANTEQWSSSFACSTPVKCETENRCAGTTVTADPRSRALVNGATGADKENVTDNDGQTFAGAAVMASVPAKTGNRRKRAVPLKRDVREPCQVLAIATDLSSTGSSTLKNSTNSSCTLTMSSSSSSRTDRSGVSRSSSGWWSKGEVYGDRSRLSASCGGNSSDLSAGASNMQPLDLSSSPLSAISPAPKITVRSSSSPSLAKEDFFYKRRRVRRRRAKPKRLNRSSFNRCGSREEDDNTSTSDRDDNDDEVARDSSCRSGIDKEVEDGNKDDREVFLGKRVGDLEMDEGNDGPRPAKIKRELDERMGDRRNNNNDDDCYDKAAAKATTSTVVAVSCCIDESERAPNEEVVVADVVPGEPSTTTVEIQEEVTEYQGSEVNNLDANQEKSAAMHSPMNKRMNGGGHHPYHMHHNSRSIMNGLTTSSSPSSLSKSLDTITTSSATHHNFHRHWLDMANDTVNNTNMMDVDGSTDDNSMAAAAAAAAAALLFSPPSSVGSGISPGALSSLHPNSHLAHHHALSPLAPLSLPPHSGSGVGLSPAHHHHHQHIQQQLQQYAAAAVAAATAAAAAAAAASSAGDSTSPPPNLPLSLPPMAHHFNQNNNISGSNKRRSGGTGLTVQQQLYRRSGTPTSSTTSSPSPRPLNSKNDADTTTSGTSLHDNGSFAVSGPPTTTTTVLWPPLGLLTAAHQQHHHSLSSPPKFQQLFGSSVNSLATATVGSQVLPSLPPPPTSSPSTPYRLASKETNGMSISTTNGNVSGNDIGIGTGTENAMNADEEDPAIDDDEDEEDEEDEEEEEEDLDDDDIEEGEEDADEEDESDRAADGGDSSSAQARRLRRQQVRRLRQLQRAGHGNTHNMNDSTDSGTAINYHQQWQQPSNTTTTANSLSQQQHRQSIGSSSQQHIDPERLKAFNMFVRLFVDENLDRQVPISRQPKDKVQAIIDSCGRQFPELSDRSRKRIRTYLKSCRRNKRNTPQSGGVSSSPPPPTNPWPANGSSSDPSAQPQRPTPAHLTSAQAETILAVACQRESDNARRMRLGLEPVAQPYPYSNTPTSAANVFQQPAGTLLLNQNGSGGTKLQMSSTSSDEDVGVGENSFDKSSSNAIEVDIEHRNGNDETENRDGNDGREGSVSTGSATAGDFTSINNILTEDSNTVAVTCGAKVTSSSPNNNETIGPTDLSVNKSSTATTMTPGTSIVNATPPVPIGSGYTSNTGFRGLSSSTSTTTVNHRRISSNNSSSTTGMLQLFPTMSTTPSISSGTPTLPLQPSMLNQTTPPAQPSSKLLNKADVVTVRQLIAGYRESAAFLLRSADELEHLLLLRG